jgi:hypothetical protein
MMSPGFSVEMSSRPSSDSALAADPDLGNQQSCGPPPRRSASGVAVDGRKVGGSCEGLGVRLVLNMRLSSSASVACDHAVHRLIGGRGLVLQLGAQLVHAFLVDELAESLDRLDADLTLRTRHERQQRVHELGIADLTEGAHDDRQRFGIARLQHLLRRGSARLLPISARASMARSLTHQSHRWSPG